MLNKTIKDHMKTSRHAKPAVKNPPLYKIVQSHSLPFKGGGTNVPEGLSQVTLTRLRHPLPEVEGKAFENNLEAACHPELAAKSVETKSKHDFMPLLGVSVSRCLKSPLPPFTKGGNVAASLHKGGGTDVPEGFKKKKAAFTLAEVLITLGIIGIVAAMTLPALMANGRKQETVARLKKFNSMMLQAILLSENDNGPYEYWNKEAMATSDESEQGDGYDIEKGSEQASRFFNTYFAPYIKYLRLEKTDKCNSGLKLTFNDGSHACLKNGGCMDFIYDVNGDRKPNKYGYDTFYYVFCPTKNSASSHIMHKTKRPFIPYYGSATEENWNNREYLLNTCKQKGSEIGNSGVCARLIEFDGWEIRDDYPFKI